MDPEVSPGSMAVHGVLSPSAMIVCVTPVRLRNATDSPARIVAGSGEATTQLFGLNGSGVSVTTTAGRSLEAVASMHAVSVTAAAASATNERFMMGWAEEVASPLKPRGADETSALPNSQRVPLGSGVSTGIDGGLNSLWLLWMGSGVRPR